MIRRTWHYWADSFHGAPWIRRPTRYVVMFATLAAVWIAVGLIYFAVTR